MRCLSNWDVEVSLIWSRYQEGSTVSLFFFIIAFAYSRFCYALTGFNQLSRLTATTGQTTQNVLTAVRSMIYKCVFLINISGYGLYPPSQGLTRYSANN
jgi:hypothetical protein